MRLAIEVDVATVPGAGGRFRQNHPALKIVH
jgi:hypothetical protein